MFTSADISNNQNFRITLNSNSYMWSYGCGAGSYTNCSNIGTTANFASDSLQTIFTMLFGSYFGDWDSDDNLLRAVIAQGQTLNSFWAGRPHWQVHHMALGENIGFGALLSQNNTGDYFISNASPQFARMISISLMGDPTTRMHYITPPSNLIVVNNNNNAELSWTGSPDTVLGYNIYRLDPNAFSYTKVNTNILTGTTYTDNSISTNGSITYIVKAVSLKTTASGSYYNQSLGVRDNAHFSGGINEQLLTDIKLYPNPAMDLLFMEGDLIRSYYIYTISGKSAGSGEVKNNIINLSSISRGSYIIELTDYNQIKSQHKLIIK
jgi:hypothetical protein